MSDAELQVALRAVADQTMLCRFTIWGFGVGGGLSGLVRASQLLDEPAYADRVLELVRPSLSRDLDPTDHLIAVEALVALRGVFAGLRLESTLRRWASAVTEAARPVKRQPRVHRPDLPDWSSTIWVDCMHTDGPGLAALGMSDAAATAAEEYAAVLQRSDGLFQHGYDVSDGVGNDVAWGRGQGWALLGLSETLLSADDQMLRERLRRLVAALADHEVDGRWRTVIDDPVAPVETSVSAFVAQGVGRAINRGLVDSSYAELAERAFAAAVEDADSGGLVVSEASPIATAAEYHLRGTGVFPWGQGPLLHAIADRIDHGKGS